jgi:hemolysin D
MNINNGNGYNSHNQNEHYPNGISNSMSSFKRESPPNPAKLLLPSSSSVTSSFSKFEQPVILQQPRYWSRAILWSLILVTSSAIVWANFAKIEEAIPATGKLEALGATKEVQAPVSGVVKEIFVEDGNRVKLGQPLLALDNTTTKVQLESLYKIQASLVQENLFYKSQLSGATVDVTDLKIPNQMLDLTKSRATLVAENQIYRTQLDGINNTKLTLEQKERLLSNQVELEARVAARQSEIDKLRRQFMQTEIRLAGIRDRLKINRRILNDITPLMRDGGIARIQVLRQEEEVRNAESEIAQLTEEKARLQAEIAQAQAELENTVAVSRRDWLNQIAENNKRIAEIDSQITKAIVENNKRIAENEAQISQAQTNLKYQVVQAPVAGTIFELKAKYPGFVVNASEPILKVVPNDNLVAQVYITNKDIGFVKEGMTTDVRIDSFPFSEFGDIKGKLVWIGSDALPPDQIYPFYRFPAKVELESQQLVVNGRKISLQSGMGVSANIKIRDRTVMSIFTDMFTSSIENFKTVR